jgi:Ca2+-binding RTX toxin-like protein
LEVRVTTTIVKDAAGLTAALKAAQAGDTIKLAAGDYSAMTITGLKYAGQVTVTSLDPSNMASLNGLILRDSQNIKFQGLEFKVSPSGYDNPFQVSGSTNIAYDGLKVHGSLNDNAADDHDAILIRNSKNVSITNSEFQELRNAISHLDSDGLNISNNYFHDLRTDGIRGGGTDNVVIKGNHFTSFHMKDGDHPDAIQFWTTNTTVSGKNIEVSGNVITRGDGDPVQGIFFRDQVGGLPYENVKITDNLVVGGMYNGISIGAGIGVVISNNTVVGLADQESWVRVADVTNLTLTNNTATDYLIDDVTGTQLNNKEVAVPTDGGKALQQQFVAAHTNLLGTLQLNQLIFTGATPLLNVSNLTQAILDQAATTLMATMDAERAKAVTVTGTDAKESLSVNAQHDTYVDAGAGNDLIYGGGIGHNTLAGGAGDDNYYVKTLTERVVEGAGAGVDTVTSTVDFTLSDNVENLRLSGEAVVGGGNALANQITGNAANNDIHGFDGNDQLIGGAGDDKLAGGNGNDNINGNAGNDTLTGDAGDDKLIADEGNDYILGGAGADTIEGGLGSDTLGGGAGADQFIFREGTITNTADVILDFSRIDGDKVSLRAVDANTGLTGDQNFSFIGTSAFHKVAGELRFEVAGGVTKVYGDVNGDGLADFTLQVNGAGTMQATDFLL